ncbi:uncharacterized protein AMSG_09745 [Thecamonas trahens ATCC 50062]|uniref:Transmembrane protein n=1 Tax=Thecamonas trahens ATCC 50062 TaxID=461836 RepID=A0A0L0DPA3_THETB|nr:hypothetical protein AMSG_09745 [Thecamonas trahens ATCC 50062]KNC54080.1 hypothetical protein AMSG_09745 [Thecamonas trahens ATCC 50062]|eukprot:XP_013754089.1 hypothetical protein AMSG_09745 [Thecamonas trahens ATCC 50062]
MHVSYVFMALVCYGAILGLVTMQSAATPSSVGHSSPVSLASTDGTTRADLRSELAMAREEGALAKRPIRTLLRRTATGTKISNRFCALNEQNECDWENYASFLLAVVVPMIVLACLMCVCGPLLACFRMCGCMGGRHPRPGLCCGKGNVDKLYSKSTIHAVKGLALVAVVVCFICLVCAYVGNARTSEGVNGVVDALIKAGDSLVAQVRAIGTSLEALPYTRDVAASISEAANSANSFVNDVRSAKKDINAYEVIRAVAANISLLVPFLMLLTSVSLGILNKRGCCIHIVFGTLITLSLSFVWLSTGIHSLLAIVFDDACDEFATFIDGSNPDNILDTLVGCSSSSGIASGFQGLADDARSGLDQSVSASCSRLEPACAVTASPRLNGCPSVCNATTLPSYRQATWTPSPNTGGQPLTLDACRTECTQGSDEQSTSVAAFTEIGDVIEYNRILSEEIIPLLNCDFLTTLVRDLFASFCTKLTSGLKMVAQSQIAMATFLMIGIFLLWLGQKRFLPVSESAEEAGPPKKVDEYGAAPPPAYHDDDMGVYPGDKELDQY